MVAQATAYSFTTPWKESYFTGIVNKSSTDPSPFRLFEPLTFELWATVMLSLAVAAVLIVLIDTIHPPLRAHDPNRAMGRVSSLKKYATHIAVAFYCAFSALLGSDDLEWGSTLPMRLLHLSLLLIVLVIVSTCACPHHLCSP